MERAKIKVIERLPPPIFVNGVRSFLGHANFYQRFIKNFSKTTKLLCQLLVKNAPFDFNKECLYTFDKLKNELISSPIIAASD